MKELSPSPSNNIKIEPNLQVDDNFKNILDTGILYISKYYKDDEFSITNNLKADPKGLSVYVTSKNPKSITNLTQGINQMKIKDRNINYNPKTYLLSYTPQNQVVDNSQQQSTTNVGQDNNTPQANNNSDIEKQIYGNVAQQFLSKTLGITEQVIEDIKRFKELIK